MEVIGVCSWILGIKQLDLLMQKISQLGFNGVQYCEDIDAYSAQDVIEAANSNGLELIIYDPFNCTPSAKNGTATKENALIFYKNAVDYAAELHIGLTIQGLSAWTKDCTSRMEAWEFLCSCVKTLSQYADLKGVPLSYEPVNLYEVPLIHTAAELSQLIDDTQCDLNIVLDSFHMNIGERDPLNVLNHWSEKLSVFHISGSNREGISQGHIDFKAIHEKLRESGYHGPCVVESVLSTNPVNTPPRNDTEMQVLSSILVQTREIWQSYVHK